MSGKRKGCVSDSEASGTVPEWHLFACSLSTHSCACVGKAVATESHPQEPVLLDTALSQAPVTCDMMTGAHVISV
jgi:hypothetical protein